MARPYSIGLRERVVSAVEDGGSCRAAAARYGVSVSAVVKWSRRYRVTGSAASGKAGGHRRVVVEPHRGLIVEAAERAPHLMVRALGNILAWRGHGVAPTICLFFQKRGVTCKKRRRTPASNNAQAYSPAAANREAYGRVARRSWLGLRVAP